MSQPAAPESPPHGGAASPQAVSFTTVTELPASLASAEQLSMAYTRYRMAQDLSAGREVLEVACGSGLGLPYLARVAHRVVGGDCDPALIRIAQRHAGERIEVRQMDAEQLPFPDGSFDVVVLLEAIYYLPRPQVFITEARRVLRAGGALYLCSANREWPGFNPSPFSKRYYSLRELGAMLRDEGFRTELSVGFPVPRRGLKSRLLNWARRTAVRYHLIPATMDGKTLLKRLVYGKLVPMPDALGDAAGMIQPLTPYTEEGPVTEHRVLYAIGRLPE